MTAFIIFGTRGVTYSGESGRFHCPRCSGATDYRHRKVRRFFTLYFIPLVPLDLLGEYVECDRCTSTWDLAVLDHDPAKADQELEAEFQVAIKRVMVLVALADGIIEDDEVTAIAEIYSKVGGGHISEARVREEIEIARQDGRGVAEYLQNVSGRLNGPGKEIVVRSAFMVATADGDFAVEEQQLIAQVADALEMTSAHTKGLLAELAEGTEGDSEGVSSHV